MLVIYFWYVTLLYLPNHLLPLHLLALEQQPVELQEFYNSVHGISLSYFCEEKVKLSFICVYSAWASEKLVTKLSGFQEEPMSSDLKCC